MHFNTLTIFLIFTLLGIIQGGKDEPQCYSRYDFEERVLEKAVRTELMMKDYMEKLDKGLETMAAYVEEFAEIKTQLEKSGAVSDDRFAAIEQTLSEWKDAYGQEFEDVKNKLEQTNEAIQLASNNRLAAMEQNISSWKQAYVHEIEETKRTLERTNEAVQIASDDRLAIMEQKTNDWKQAYVQMLDDERIKLEEAQLASNNQMAEMKQSLSDWRQEARSSVPTVAFNVRQAINKHPGQYTIITFSACTAECWRGLQRGYRDIYCPCQRNLPVWSPSLSIQKKVRNVSSRA